MFWPPIIRSSVGDSIAIIARTRGAADADPCIGAGGVNVHLHLCVEWILGSSGSPHCQERCTKGGCS